MEGFIMFGEKFFSLYFIYFVGFCFFIPFTLDISKDRYFTCVYKRLMFANRLKFKIILQKYIIENQASFQWTFEKKSSWFAAFDFSICFLSADFVAFSWSEKVSLTSSSISDSLFRILKQSMSEKTFIFSLLQFTFNTPSLLILIYLERFGYFSEITTTGSEIFLNFLLPLLYFYFYSELLFYGSWWVKFVSASNFFCFIHHSKACFLF